MWRRVASLSPVISSSSWRCILNQQGAHRWNIFELFSTEGAHRWNIFELFSTEMKEAPLTMKDLFITFVLGGPGSGKGTQCSKIVETFGYVHLSAGELLRREITSNSEYGTMILNTIKEGNIVPSEVTVRLIRKEMEASDNHKFLIDGFPRNEENRIAFEKIIGADPDVVLFFDCPEEEMVKRVLNRNQGRVDDNIETIKRRLEVFNASNHPVVSYYAQKGKLYKIDGVGTEDEIFERVRPVFAAFEGPK